MWWFTPAALLTISLAVYTYSAAHVYTFSPLHTKPADAAAEPVARQAPQTPPAQWLRLWPGETIAMLPFEVPVPADGSLTAMPRTKQPDRAELSVPSSLSGLLTFYRTELADAGWQEVRSWMARPVGQGDGPGTAFSIFCRAAEGPALLVAIAHDPAAGGSSLRLRLSGEQPTPCDADTMPTPGSGPGRPDRSMPPLQ